MEKLEEAAEPTGELKIERPYSLPGILLGTSAFTANGWQGSFYPPGMHSRDFLSYYATQFATVEVDSSFYGIFRRDIKGLIISLTGILTEE